MSIDIFQSRTMLAALEIRKPPRTFLLDTFFPGVETSDTEYVDIDILKHKRRLAPFVSQVSEGKQMEHEKYSTYSFKPAYLKPKMTTAAADLLARTMGTPVYANQTPQERAALRLAQDMATMQNAIIRRKEWMAAQAMATGTIPVVGEGVNVTVDFGMAGSHKVVNAGAALWTASTGTPLEDLRTWKRLVAQDCGLVPSVCVMGQSVVDAFTQNAEVKAVLLQWRNQAVDLTFDLLPDGVTVIGRIENLTIYAYDEWYLRDSDLTEQPMVPVNQLLLGCPGARATQHHGAIIDLDAGGNGVAAVPYFPKSWRIPDPSAQWVMLQSAPLVTPHEIDAFLVATPI